VVLVLSQWPGWEWLPFSSSSSPCLQVQTTASSSSEACMRTKKFSACSLSNVIAPTREWADDSALMQQFVHFPRTTGNSECLSVEGTAGRFVQLTVGRTAPDSTVRSTRGRAGWRLSPSALRATVSEAPSRFDTRPCGLLEAACLLDVARLEN